MGDFRWRQLAGSQEGLFPQPRRVVGRGAYRGLTFHEVEARSIINRAPPGTPWFNYTINAYRGCSHACSYCLAGDTPILMANGSSKAISQIRPGDRVYGTRNQGRYRRLVEAEVLDRWTSLRAAYRIRCADGTTLIASADHLFLTDRGWKHVVGTECGHHRRPHLTLNNRLVGLGQMPVAPKAEADYRLGYLCGLIRGDGSLGTYSSTRPSGKKSTVHRFRLALVDREALDRARDYLEGFGLSTDLFLFSPAAPARKELWAVRNSKQAAVERVRQILEWPQTPTDLWVKGFLAGIFDAEGSYSRGVLRISNKDPEIVERIVAGLMALGFDAKIEEYRPVMSVRIRGGRNEHLRFFLSVDPAITRKRSLLGTAVKFPPNLRISEIEPLGIDIPMYDLTTTTGDFIANGVVSHNCFARPTHEYLGFNIGTDFDSQIVVKVNAVDLVRAETAPAIWGGDHIAMGTNTDPYQAAEGKYRLTQGIIQVLAGRENPFSILTKSTLVLRDLSLIAEAAKRAEVRVDFSVATVDEDVWKRTEPGTPHPRKRLEAVARFRQAGVRSGVMMAPLLPGISDHPDQIAAVRKAAAAAGAESCHQVKLHLRGVRGHFLDWLKSDSPELLRRYEQMYPVRRPGARRTNAASDSSQLSLDF